MKGICLRIVLKSASGLFLSFTAPFLLVALGSCQPRESGRATTTPPGAANPPSQAQLLENVRYGVVQIAISVPPGTKIKNELASQFEGEILLVGTGVFVNDTGDVLTAAHVVNDAYEKLGRMQASGDPASIVLGLSTPSLDGLVKFRKGTDYISVDPTTMATENQYDLGLLSIPFLLRSTPREPPPPGIVRSPTPVRLPVKISLIRPEETAPVFACGFVPGSPVLRTTVGTIASAWDNAIPMEAVKLGGK